MDLVRVLLDKHVLGIREYIRRRSGPVVLRHTTIDDLYQQTVLAALQCADQLRSTEEGVFLAWVATIARRVILAAVPHAERAAGNRRIRRPDSSSDGVDESDLPGHKRTPLMYAAAADDTQWLERATAKLPDKCRQAFILGRLEDRPLDEVARQLGVSKGHASRLIEQAVKLLRAMVAER